MGKVVVVISGAITAFILALTAGAIYAYRSVSTSGPNAPSAANDQQSINQAASTVQPAVAQTPTSVPDVSPQDAASIAAKFMNRTDLYSVEIGSVKGAPVYKVTFSSGDVAFVSLQGQMLSIQSGPTPGPVATMGGSVPKQSQGGGSRGGSGGGENEAEAGGG
ncbi:MAG TPA: hypothetical protein VF784_12700 [Anaerolineales bacterium]